MTDLLRMKNGFVYLGNKKVEKGSKDNILKTMQEIRGLVYACFTRMLRGRAALVRDTFQRLPALLVRDVMILIRVLEQEESQADLTCSESLNSEGLELMVQLMAEGLVDMFELTKTEIVELRKAIEQYASNKSKTENTGGKK